MSAEPYTQLRDVMREFLPHGSFKNESIKTEINTPEPRSYAQRKAMENEILTYAQMLCPDLRGHFKVLVSPEPSYRQLKRIKDRETGMATVYGLREIQAEVAVTGPCKHIPLYRVRSNWIGSGKGVYGKMSLRQEVAMLETLRQAVAKAMEAKFGQDYKKIAMEQFAEYVGEDVTVEARQGFWQRTKQALRLKRNQPPPYTP
ncbi:Nse1 non-SMC component of SMC5-6 complex [Macrophomina phaseolina MS6]|uniref:Nse1 non-SMC component of SMC5-6 complex n=1 Tax=Macrophomina phaseolina (strain MS6) TaxID=1126212 RepID=K2SCJ0_MACPH|nr:Nse1 non-SMC component of SMC5-6 complex [Macrophomina phaseolina MS6]